MKYNIDGCNLQASMKNNFFIKKIFTDLQALSKLRIACPLKKVISDWLEINKNLKFEFEYFQGEYRITNLVFEDNTFPKAMPRNIKGIGTLKAFTNISNTNVEIWNVRINGEFKWYKNCINNVNWDNFFWDNFFFGATSLRGLSLVAPKKNYLNKNHSRKIPAIIMLIDLKNKKYE